MPKNKDTHKEPTPIIEEVENQLEKIFNKKKEEIEEELEGKIKQEKEEAKEKISQIERELEEEKKALIKYRTTLVEFENNKADTKSQIKEHLDKAMQSLTEIDTLTAQTLEELKKVNELSQRLEQFHHAAEEKTSILKKDLEERFGIVAEGLETKGHEDVDLKQEMVKLRKIKELLGPTEAAN
jgi:chromosome segregation ATPase